MNKFWVCSSDFSGFVIYIGQNSFYEIRTLAICRNINVGLWTTKQIVLFIELYNVLVQVQFTKSNTKLDI